MAKPRRNGAKLNLWPIWKIDEREFLFLRKDLS